MGQDDASQPAALTAACGGLLPAAALEGELDSAGLPGLPAPWDPEARPSSLGQVLLGFKLCWLRLGQTVPAFSKDVQEW